MNILKGLRPATSTAFPPGSETALLSGRFGDYVYFVRNAKQFRRRYVVPTDRRTPGQLRTRATFGAAAKYWSHSDQLSDPARQAWETAANQVQSRPRLEQSGPLTGQQYFVGCACKGQCGLRNADGGMKRLAQAPAEPQAARGQGLRRTTPEPRHYIARPTCGPGPAVAGTTRRSRQRLSIATRPRAGAGREQRIRIRTRPEARRGHSACSYGEGMARFRCGTHKALAAQGLREGWRFPAVLSGMPRPQQPSVNPKGIPSVPGLRAARYPGSPARDGINSEGVASCGVAARCEWGSHTTHSGPSKGLYPSPRTALGRRIQLLQS